MAEKTATLTDMEEKRNEIAKEGKSSRKRTSSITCKESSR